MAIDLELDGLFDELADSKAYTPVGGEATTILCVVVKEAMEQVEDAMGSRTAARVLEVLLDARTITPQEDDKLTHNSEVWTLTGILAIASDTSHAVFGRPESIERASPGYRK